MSKFAINRNLIKNKLERKHEYLQWNNTKKGRRGIYRNASLYQSKRKAILKVRKRKPMLFSSFMRILNVSEINIFKRIAIIYIPKCLKNFVLFTADGKTLITWLIKNNYIHFCIILPLHKKTREIALRKFNPQLWVECEISPSTEWTLKISGDGDLSGKLSWGTLSWVFLKDLSWVFYLRENNFGDGGAW